MTHMAAYSSPLGPIVLRWEDDALTGLWFADQANCPQCSGLVPAEDCPAFDPARRWLELYFSGRDPGFVPPLRLDGTAFQRAVWALLSDIPYGATRTYGDLAAQLARARGLQHMSAQAVGGAVGRNPISLIIPCHRVVGASGDLTGYAGGLERKRALLALEGSLPPRAQGENRNCEKKYSVFHGSVIQY